MAFTSKSDLKKALTSSKTSWSQRGGQTASKILKTAPGYKMSARQTEQFLEKSGMSESGAKKVMQTLEQPAQPKSERKGFEKQDKSEITKAPEWIEKVENPGEKAPQKSFGRKTEEDVRLQKAGQLQAILKQKQPSSDVDPTDRSRFSPNKINELEQGEQTKYFQGAAQTKKFDDLDKKEDDEAAKIDALLGGH